MLTDWFGGRLQGAVFVTRRAKDFLTGKLQRWIHPNGLLDRIPTVKLEGCKFGTPEDIAQMTSEFDKSTKHCFRNHTEPAFIPFGSVKDRDLAFNIKSGKLKLPG